MNTRDTELTGPSDKDAGKGYSPRSDQAQALLPTLYIPAEKKEMDFVDLLVIFWRWKWVFAGVFLACLIAALCLAFLFSPAYRYTAMIQTAGIGSVTGFHPVVSPAALVGRITNVYAPLALSEGGDETRSFKPVASVPHGANAIVISVDAPRSKQQQAVTLLNNIGKMTSDNTNQLLGSYLQSKKKYLRTEIAQDQERLETLERQGGGSDASGQPQNPANALYFAGLINDLRGQIANLSQQLNVDLVANVQRAGPVANVTRSVEPVGISRGLIVLIGILVGLVLGMLCTIGAQLGANVQRRLASRQGSYDRTP